MTNSIVKIIFMPPRQCCGTCSISKSRCCLRVKESLIVHYKSNHGLLYGSFSQLNRSASQYCQHVQPPTVKITCLIVEVSLHLPLITPYRTKHARTNSIYNIQRHSFKVNYYLRYYFLNALMKNVSRLYYILYLFL